MGHASVAPSQLSATSHTPAETRHSSPRPLSCRRGNHPRPRRNFRQRRIRLRKRGIRSPRPLSCRGGSRPRPRRNFRQRRIRPLVHGTPLPMPPSHLLGMCSPHHCSSRRGRTRRRKRGIRYRPPFSCRLDTSKQRRRMFQPRRTRRRTHGIPYPKPFPRRPDTPKQHRRCFYNIAFASRIATYRAYREHRTRTVRCRSCGYRARLAIVCRSISTRCVTTHAVCAETTNAVDPVLACFAISLRDQNGMGRPSPVHCSLRCRPTVTPRALCSRRAQPKRQRCGSRLIASDEPLLLRPYAAVAREYVRRALLIARSTVAPPKRPHDHRVPLERNCLAEVVGPCTIGSRELLLLAPYSANARIHICRTLPPHIADIVITRPHKCRVP